MPTTVIIKRKILFGDCDPKGLVYTPRYSYFAVEAIDEALSVLLKGPGLRTLMGFNILPPARAFSLEFLRSVTWDDELTMEVRVDNVGEHSFTFSIAGYIAKDIIAFTASLTHVCISPETKKTVKLPDELRELLQKQ